MKNIDDRTRYEIVHNIVHMTPPSLTGQRDTQ